MKGIFAAILFLVAVIVLTAMFVLRNKAEPVPLEPHVKIKVEAPKAEPEVDSQPIDELLRVALADGKPRSNAGALREAGCTETPVDESGDGRFVGWAKDKRSVRFVTEKYPALVDRLKSTDDADELYLAYRVAYLSGLPGEGPTLLRDRAAEKGSVAARVEKLADAGDVEALQDLAKAGEARAALALADLSSQAHRTLWFCRAGELGDAQGKYQCGMAVLRTTAGREKARAMLTDAAGMGIADAARVLSEHFQDMAKVGETDADKYAQYWRCQAYLLGSPGF